MNKFKTGDYVRNEYDWVGVVTIVDNIYEKQPYFVDYGRHGRLWEMEHHLSPANNGDYIRYLEDEKLAERLISDTTDDEGISCYQLPQGGIAYGWDSAVELTVEWLKEVHTNNGEV